MRPARTRVAKQRRPTTNVTAKPGVGELFAQAANLMRAEFEEVRAGVPHKGVAGAESQQIVIEFLNRHLPGRFKTAEGFIIDQMDTISGHIDGIVFDAHNCPVYRATANEVIVPADNVAAGLEVKFKLTSSQLKIGLKKIREIQNLSKTPFGIGDTSTTIGTLAILFAFESTLSHGAVVRALQEELQRPADMLLLPGLIVVLDQGIYCTYRKPPWNGQMVGFVSDVPPRSHSGLEFGVIFIPYAKQSLGAMIGFLLEHLSTFREKIHNPGLHFSADGEASDWPLIVYEEGEPKIRPKLSRGKAGKRM